MIIFLVIALLTFVIGGSIWLGLFLHKMDMKKPQQKQYVEIKLNNGTSKVFLDVLKFDETTYGIVIIKLANKETWMYNKSEITMIKHEWYKEYQNTGTKDEK